MKTQSGCPGALSPFTPFLRPRNNTEGLTKNGRLEEEAKEQGVGGGGRVGQTPGLHNSPE